jgi:hypothetical protein
MDFLGRLKDRIGENRKVDTYTGSISSLSSAYISLKNKLNLKSTGRSAICIKNARTIIDQYNCLWFIIVGKTLEDVVAATMSVSDTIELRGFSDELLVCVFDFIDDDLVQYLIYSYKLHKFYPFVPTGKQQNKRDHSQELKIMAAVGNDIPFESDMLNWYPIWDVPN